MNLLPILALLKMNWRLVLEEGSGMIAGIDFHLAYSPEREDPGRENASLKQYLKWSEDTPKCGDLAESLYSTAKH